MNWSDLDPFKRAPRKAGAADFTWVELTPAAPFAGLARFSSETKSPFPLAVKVTGAGLEAVRADMTGKLLDYSRAPKNGASLTLDALKGLLRA